MENNTYQHHLVILSGKRREYYYYRVAEAVVEVLIVRPTGLGASASISKVSMCICTALFKAGTWTRRP